MVGPKQVSASDAYEGLSAEQKRGLVELMWEARNIARRTPSAERIMVEQIKHLAFYWTTSAFCPTRRLVIPDAIKRELGHMKHTADAHRALRSNASDGIEVVHEHAVPRSLLARHVLDEAGSIDEVADVFERHCTAVLVTRAEDLRLNAIGLREQMPDGWAWGDDPLARYAAASIDVFPPMADAACACGAENAS